MVGLTYERRDAYVLDGGQKRVCGPEASTYSEGTSPRRRGKSGLRSLPHWRRSSLRTYLTWAHLPATPHDPSELAARISVLAYDHHHIAWRLSTYGSRCLTSCPLRIGIPAYLLPFIVPYSSVDVTASPYMVHRCLRRAATPVLPSSG